ncbi:MAG: helix-turn-helix transcriptional regulator [Kiritimatiellae bacterium]|nr:helix-turn-helix transcriptional regulator [Kiritimatiellia bacterium]
MADGFRNVQIHVLVCKYQPILRWHHRAMSAPYWRLYWNRARGATVSLNGVRYELGPRQVLLISPNTPFDSDLKGTMHHLYVHFTAGLPYDMLASRIFDHGLTPEMQREVRALVSALSRGAGGLDHADSLRVHSLISHYLARIPESVWPAEPADIRILEAQQLMRRNLRQPLPNAELARAVGMSTNAFIRLFRLEAGRPPQTHLMLRRLDRACILLQHTAKSIDEIAEDCGFCDRHHFTKMFTRYRGTGPAQFRRNRNFA